MHPTPVSVWCHPASRNLSWPFLGSPDLAQHTGSASPRRATTARVPPDPSGQPGRTSRFGHGCYRKIGTTTPKTRSAPKLSRRTAGAGRAAGLRAAGSAGGRRGCGRRGLRAAGAAGGGVCGRQAAGGRRGLRAAGAAGGGGCGRRGLRAAGDRAPGEPRRRSEPPPGRPVTSSAGPPAGFLATAYNRATKRS